MNIGNEEVILYQLINVYVEKPMEKSKKLQEETCEFSKVVGHKINMRSSVVFLYMVTNNWH